MRREIGRSNFNPEGRAVLDLGLAMVIHTGGDRTGMVEPLLDLGNISAIVEGDGRGGGAERMGAEARDILDDAGCFGMGSDDLIDALRMERLFQNAGGAISKRPEEGAF